MLNRHRCCYGYYDTFYGLHQHANIYRGVFERESQQITYTTIMMTMMVVQICFFLYLYVHFVKLIEKVFNPIFILDIVQNNKTDLWCCDECWDEPIIKFVYGLQVHIIRFPNMFIYQIQGGMGNKLVQVAMIFFLKSIIINMWAYFTSGTSREPDESWMMTF